MVIFSPKTNSRKQKGHFAPKNTHVMQIVLLNMIKEIIENGRAEKIVPDHCSLKPASRSLQVPQDPSRLPVDQFVHRAERDNNSSQVI